jgi:hypothetical protein
MAQVAWCRHIFNIELPPVWMRGNYSCRGHNAQSQNNRTRTNNQSINHQLFIPHRISGNHTQAWSKTVIVNIAIITVFIFVSLNIFWTHNPISFNNISLWIVSTFLNKREQGIWIGPTTEIRLILVRIDPLQSSYCLQRKKERYLLFVTWQ